MTSTPLDLQNRDELAQFLDGRRRPEVEEIVVSVGVDKALARVFDVMAGEYDTSRAPDEPVAVQWVIDAPGERQLWHTLARPDGCVCAPGPVDEPDVELRMNLMTFLEIMAGRTKGMKALSTGRLKLKGDLLLATSIEKWFGNRPR